MKKIILLILAFVLVSWSGRAFADYSFTYTDAYGANLSGMLFTSPNGDGSVTVTGGYINGALGGFANIFPGAGIDGSFIWDNQLLPNSTPMLTNSGLLFKSSSGSNNYEINIWGNSGANDYSYYATINGQNFTIANDSKGTFTASAVPIPAAIWLFGAGLMSLVGVRRRFTA